MTAINIKEHYGTKGAPARKLEPSTQLGIANALQEEFIDLTIYPDSVTAVPGGVVAAARNGELRKIIVVGKVAGFDGPTITMGDEPAMDCDANSAHMQALRDVVEWLQPILAGDTPSVGLGDRLGLATPGHIAAGRDSGFVLTLAQQSIREMTRTRRTPQQVMDEACFGVFETGYDAGYATDADHLKTPLDVYNTAGAGFRFFTIDPSDHVDQQADNYSADEVREHFEKLIADEVPNAERWVDKYVGKSFDLEGQTLEFDELTIKRAAVKYGRAVAHCVDMTRHINGACAQHEIEISVDETDQPTTAAEHLFVARELQDAGVKIDSLAPRFVGEFEKGIDYKGDLQQFESELVKHAAIARQFGGYKLSIHSGSDKFTVYPIVARVTKGKLHLKTAGTSYLEALRVIVRHDKDFFRELVRFCRDRFDTDKATYHISSSLDKVPAADDLPDEDLERVYLDEDDGRQILHVTFGSVLITESNGQPLYRNRLLGLVNKHADTYVEVLSHHIGRHIKGLADGMPG